MKKLNIMFMLAFVMASPVMSSEVIYGADPGDETTSDTEEEPVEETDLPEAEEEAEEAN